MDPMPALTLIDMSKRKRWPNPDGTFSSVKSMSFNMDGKEFLIPTLRGEDGVVMEPDQAIDHFFKTGEYLGEYSTPAEATAAAEAISAGTLNPGEVKKKTQPRMQTVPHGSSSDFWR